MTTPPVRAHWTATGIAHGGSDIPDLSDFARRAGGYRASGAADRRCPRDPVAAGRHRAGLCAGNALAGAAARTRAAAGIAATDLFRQRRHELARIQVQPASDHPVVGRLRDLYRDRGCGRDALSDRPAVGHRIPARRHCRAAGRRRTAGDRAKARTAAPNCRGA